MSLCTARRPVEQLLHGRRERLVGEVLVGEHGVAAIGRHVDAVEDRAHRRLGDHGRVGVPVLADIGRVARLAADHHDFRDLSMTVAKLGWRKIVAEAAGEGLVLRDVDLLVAEEHDAVLVQRVADLADRAVVEILRDIDAEDLRAAGAGDRPHLDPTVPHGVPYWLAVIDWRSASCRAP